jgi:NAD dependent epimerase/dehydratase family enzyme
MPKLRVWPSWKIAAALASGNQPVSWIHVDDLVEVFTQLVEQKINHGVYNAVTGFDSNKEITKKIAVLNGQSFLMPAIPSFSAKNYIWPKGRNIYRWNPHKQSKVVECRI